MNSCGDSTHNRALIVASRRLTASKHYLERRIEGLRYGGWWRQLVEYFAGIHAPITDYRAALSPTKFVDVCLPFSDVLGKADEEWVEVLEAHLVLGGTSMSYPHRAEEDQHRLLDMLNTYTDESATLVQRCDAAHYIQVGELPVYAAYEGKNRVELYQYLGKSIKAFVRRTAYPGPSSLRVERTFPFGHYVLICTEHFAAGGREIRILPFPEAVLPLLSAYGVSISQRRSQFMPFSHLRCRDARRRVTGDQMFP